MKYIITIKDINTERISKLFNIEEFYLDSEIMTAYNEKLEIALAISGNIEITIEVGE